MQWPWEEGKKGRGKKGNKRGRREEGREGCHREIDDGDEVRRGKREEGDERVVYMDIIYECEVMQQCCHINSCMIKYEALLLLLLFLLCHSPRK